MLGNDDPRERSAHLRHACAELERRLRAGTGRAEDVLAECQTLAADPDAALEVMYTEFVVRQELGERPTPAEWYARFPARRADLEQLFQVDRLARPGLLVTQPGGWVSDGEALGGATGGRLGKYDLLEELGRGGMGVVWKARQEGLNRHVAVKVVLGGVQAGSQAIDRLRREAEAVARLRHPNIVQVHEVGEHQGQAYFSMELVEGSLEKRLAAGPLPPRQAAWLVEALARAMRAAHEAGIVHRDLKPANVLLAGPGEAAIEQCVPKVVDFGLAKWVQEEGGGRGWRTETGAIVGTPSYMAPEQAEGLGNEVGPAADVWALGAVLYECLTRRPPFLAAGALETLLQVRCDEPVSPRLLNAQVPLDLETVCLKCLRKDPGQRYAGCQELADDLKRWQEGKPVLARRPGAGERLVKWARRNRAVSALTAAVAVLLIAGTGVSSYFAWRASDEAGRTREALGELDEALEVQQEKTREALRQYHTAVYVRQLAEARERWRNYDIVGAEYVLKGCKPELRGWEWRHVDHLCKTKPWTLKGHTEIVFGVAYSPDCTRLASTSEDGTVRVWDARTGQELRILKGHEGGVRGVAFSPDGKRLASAGTDQTVKVWNVATGREVLSLEGHTGHVRGVAFSPDGGRLASCGEEDRMVKVWDARTGQALLTFERHTGAVSAVAFSPDGGRLASAGSDKTVRVWDAQTGREVLTLAAGSWCRTVAFSPDGGRLAANGRHFEAAVWDARTGQLLHTLRGHRGDVGFVAFSPDGNRLVSSSLENVKVWDARTGEELDTLIGGRVTYGVAYCPDGKHLATGCGHDVRVWDMRTRDEFRIVGVHTDSVVAVAFSPDGKQLSSGGLDNAVTVWDVESGRQIRSFKMLTDDPVGRARSPDGKYIAEAGEDDEVLVKVADAATGRILGAIKETSIVRVRDAATGEVLLTLRGHTDAVTDVAYSPDGHRIVTCSPDGTVRVWDTRTGQELLCLKGHSGRVTCVAFSPDGRHLASGGLDRKAILWVAGAEAAR